MEIKNLIKLLKNYKENKTRLNIKLKELKNLRMALKHIEPETNLRGINYDSEGIHSINTITDKTGNSIENADTKKLEIEEKITETEEKVRKLRKDVEAIDDRLDILTNKEKLLLTAKYIEECSYADIGNRVYYQQYSETRSPDTIKRIIEKALQKIAKI